MALNDEPEAAPRSEVLERAVGLLREERPDGWEDVRGRVRRRVSSLVSPAQQFAAYAEAGRRGSQVSVSSRVVRPALRARLDGDQRVVEQVDLVAGPRSGADGPAGSVGSPRRLAGVRVDLSCRYGLDLQREGDEVRRLVGEVVGDLLGPDPGFDPGRDIAVRVVDVVLGDPRDD